MLSSRASAFAGSPLHISRPAAPVRPARLSVVSVEAVRICQMTGKKRNKANKVCFSNKKSRVFQEVNLQHKRLWWEKEQRWVKMRLSVSAMRTIARDGLEAVAAKNGVDLLSMPYIDASESRIQWKASQPVRPPMSKKGKMKNPEKLAASKKGPMVAEFCYGKIAHVRAEPGTNI